MHIILYLKTTLKAIETVILKLIQHLQSLEKGLKLIQIRNNNL